MIEFKLLSVPFQSKEPAEPKWKPGTQSRANRVGRGNYPSRYVSHGEPTFDYVIYVQSQGIWEPEGS